MNKTWSRNLFSYNTIDCRLDNIKHFNFSVGRNLYLINIERRAETSGRVLNDDYAFPTKRIFLFQNPYN